MIRLQGTKIKTTVKHRKEVGCSAKAWEDKVNILTVCFGENVSGWRKDRVPVDPGRLEIKQRKSDLLFIH